MHKPFQVLAASHAYKCSWSQQWECRDAAGWWTGNLTYAGSSYTGRTVQAALDSCECTWTLFESAG